MITLPVLFVLLTLCAAVYSVTMVMRYYDSQRQWLRGSGLDLTIVAFLIIFSLRYVVVYVHLQNKGLKYLDTIYWSLYFLEHLTEAVIWSTFAVTIQLRRGKRTTDHLDFLRHLATLSLGLMGLAVVILLALFLSASLDKTVEIMRQLSLVLTVTLAVVEYTALWIKSSLFINPLTVLTPVETKLILLAPTITLIVGISVCGVPEFVEPLECTIIELMHTVVLCTAVVYTWHLISSRNGECDAPGAAGCPSTLRRRHRHRTLAWGGRSIDVLDLHL